MVVIGIGQFKPTAVKGETENDFVCWCAMADPRRQSAIRMQILGLVKIERASPKWRVMIDIVLPLSVHIVRHHVEKICTIYWHNNNNKMISDILLHCYSLSNNDMKPKALARRGTSYPSIMRGTPAGTAADNNQ